MDYHKIPVREYTWTLASQEAELHNIWFEMHQITLSSY